MAHAAASATLAALESALRLKQLDRTLTTALPPLDRTDPAALVPTDLPPLDEVLRGGLPRGQLSELAGAQSSGRTTVLMQLLAAATQRGEIVALIDASDCLDVASAAAAGIDLDRVLWVRGSTMGVREARQTAVERAIKALNLVLQAGGFSIVALDLGDVSIREIKSLPYTTWLRVQRVIEGGDTACVLIVPEPVARSPGGLTLTLTGTARWDGASDRSRRLTGADVCARVVSPRRRVDGGCHLRFGM